jgi:hypothetical protein
MTTIAELGAFLAREKQAASTPATAPVVVPVPLVTTNGAL